MRRADLAWKAGVLTALLAAAFLAQRIFITVDVGAEHRSVIELLPIVMACAAVALVVWTRGRVIAPFLRTSFLAVWGPYLALTVALPIVGTAVGGYPLRTLAAVEVPFFAVSALVLGSSLQLVDQRGLVGWGLALMVTMLVVAGYAVLQQLLVGNVLPSGPWTSLLSWDASTQEAYSSNVILGRSSAFFINPNILGAAAGTSALLGLFVARGWVSYTIVFASFEALLVSQSRGAAAALIASLAAMLLIAWRRHERIRLETIAPYAAVAVLAVACWLALVLVGTPAGTMVERVARGIEIVGGGSDPNVAGRIEFWRAGLTLLASHPLGTFGSPEQLLGTAVDSDWVRALLQGSVIYAAALAVALIGGALMIGGDAPEGRLLQILTVFVAVAAVTQLPLAYPSAYLYWAVVGCAMVTAARIHPAPRAAAP